MVETDCIEALVGVENLAPQKLPPEEEIFQHAQRGLQRVAMAEIVRTLGKGELGLAAFKRDRSACWHQQPRTQPEQRGLARAVGAGDRQNFAGASRKVEVGKHLPAAPHTCHTTPREPHFSSSSALYSLGVAQQNL